MFTKALIVDISIKIPDQYMRRVKKLFKHVEAVSSSDPNFKTKLADVDAIFCNISTRISKEIIDIAPKLKYIGTLSTAYDGVDANYARTKKITVANLGGYSTEAVAEWIFAALFEHMRELERAKQQARTGDYAFVSFMGAELAGKTLGVIGAGKIGSRVAEIGLGIGMKVQYYSPHKKSLLEKKGAKKATLDRLFKTSDVVSLNIIQNKDTDGMIGKAQLVLMKQGAIFVNTAGMRPIVWNAMTSALKDSAIDLIFHNTHGLNLGMIAALQSLKNVEFYPGIAFRTKESMTAMFETFTSNIEHFAKGKPQNVVN